MVSLLLNVLRQSGLIFSIRSVLLCPVAAQLQIVCSYLNITSVSVSFCRTKAHNPQHSICHYCVILNGPEAINLSITPLWSRASEQLLILAFGI
jgi:hypothetical protein